MIVTVGDGGGGGQCSADSASHSSALSSAASLSQLLLISISLYRGLFDFNHCKAASTFAGRRQQQTKPIALPPVHARGVKSSPADCYLP